MPRTSRPMIGARRAWTGNWQTLNIRTVDGGKTLPEVGLDDVFLREASREESLTVLVMKDRDTNTIFADAIYMDGARI